jgi:flagella synthesis protein FlgN
MHKSAELSAGIRSERAGIQALVEVLTDERAALSRGDTDHLADLASRKRELLLNIAHLGEQRNRLLERDGVTADRRGMESWLEAHDQGGTARADWHALIELTHSAHRLNQENGVFIDAGMRSNQEALQALMSAGPVNETYGPGGRSMRPRLSRPLASA